MILCDFYKNLTLGWTFIILLFCFFSMILSFKIKKGPRRGGSGKILLRVLSFALLILSVGSFYAYYKADNFYRLAGNSNLLLSIQAKPVYFNSYLKLAQEYYKEKDYDKVIGICNRALKFKKIMGPEVYFSTKFYLACAYFNKQDIKNTLITFDNLIVLGDDNQLKSRFADWPEVIFYEGIKYFRFKQFALAIGKYKEALKFFPDNKVLLFAIGECSYFFDKPDQAIREFNKILRLGSSYCQVYYYLAELYFRQNRPRDAIAAYMKFADADSENGVNKNNLLFVYLKIGGIYESLNDFNMAEKIYKKLLDYPETETEGRRHLGVIYEMQGNVASAADLYKMISRDKKQAAIGYLLLGKMYLNMGYPDLAFEYFKKTVASVNIKEQRDIYVFAVKTIGEIYKKQEKFDQAIRYFKKLKKLAPSEMSSNIALVYLKKGDLNTALKVLNNAFDVDLIRNSLGWDISPVYVSLLSEYKAKGNIKKAHEVSEKILQFKPQFCADWESVGIYLAQEYYSEKKYSEAARISQKMLDFYRDHQETVPGGLALVKKIKHETNAH